MRQQTLPVTLLCAIAIGIAVFSAGCAIPISLPEGVESQIPDGANRVDIITDQSVDELFTSVQEWLTAQGYSTETANDVSRTIDTNSADIGQRTSMKIRLRINPYERGSKLEAIGSWSSDVEEATFASASDGVSSEEIDWWPAMWQGSDRASYAYAKLVSAFHDMPAQEKHYVKQ